MKGRYRARANRVLDFSGNADELMKQVQQVIEGECPYCPGFRLQVVPDRYNPDELWGACPCCGFQFQGQIPARSGGECGLSVTGWPDGMGGAENVGRCGHMEFALMEYA